MTFTKVSNPILPSHSKWLTWPLDVCGGVGMGDFTDLVCIWKNFLPNLWGEIFSPTYHGVRLLSALYVMSDVFFSAGYFSPRNLFAWVFPLEITHNPLKSQMVAPKIHQIFGQLTDSDFSIIFKGFWNNGGQNSLKRERKNSFPLTPTRKVRTDVRTHVRWRHNQIFSDGWFTKFYYPWCSAARSYIDHLHRSCNLNRDL